MSAIVCLSTLQREEALFFVHTFVLSPVTLHAVLVCVNTVSASCSEALLECTSTHAVLPGVHMTLACVYRV